MNNDFEQLPDHDRIMWLANRLSQLEELVFGQADVVSILLTHVTPQAGEKIRQELMELANQLPEGSLRKTPYWTAIGMLAFSDPTFDPSAEE